MKLDKSQPFAKIVQGKDDKRRVHYEQNGIDFDIQGNPLDESQVKAYYAEQAAVAQAAADEALSIAQAAQEEADKTRASLGVSKAAVSKAKKEL